MFYTRSWAGEILRFDPATSLGEVLNPYPNVVAPKGCSYGVIFDVFDKDITALRENEKREYFFDFL